jgi:hypothetical protein
VLTFVALDGPLPPSETFYPALTRRTRESTRKLGNTNIPRPCTLTELFGESKLGILEVEKVEEPKVDLDDTL